MLVYQVASRKATIGSNKGKTVFYAKPTDAKILSSDAVEDQLISKTMMSRGDIRLALTALAETIQWAIAQGLSVDLGDLGTFKIVAHSKMVLKESDVNASNIKRPRVRFYPRQRMREAARSVSISVRPTAGVSLSPHHGKTKRINHLTGSEQPNHASSSVTPPAGNTHEEHSGGLEGASSEGHSI